MTGDLMRRAYRQDALYRIGDKRGIYGDYPPAVESGSIDFFCREIATAVSEAAQPALNCQATSCPVPGCDWRFEHEDLQMLSEVSDKHLGMVHQL